MKYYDPASPPNHNRYHTSLDYFTATLKQQYGLLVPSANLVLDCNNYVFFGSCSIVTNFDYGIRFDNCYFIKRLSFDGVEI